MIGLIVTGTMVGLSTLGVTWLASWWRRLAEHRRHQDQSEAPPVSGRGLVGSDSASEPGSWTTLDDHQLVRLLRDSSP
jgi:hypothetical protein